MNKTTVYCVASALAVSMVSSPVTNVLAKNIQPVKLEEKAQQTISVDAFIQKYLSTSEIVKDADKKDVVVYKLITKADETNYQAILEGNNLFQTLTKENQDEIVNAYETQANLKKQDGCTLSAYQILVNEANDVLSNLISQEKTNLNNLLKDINGLNVNDYTKTSYSGLKAVVDEASELLNSSSVTLEQLTNESMKLNQSKSALVNISDLKKMVEQSKSYVSDDYTVKSYNAYQNVLSQAKNLLKNDSCTASEVEQTQEELNLAVTSLVKKADFSSLQETVNSLQEFLEKNEESLTQESYQGLKEQLDSANLILQNPDSTQEAIDQTVSELNTYFNDSKHVEYKVSLFGGSQKIAVQSAKEQSDRQEPASQATGKEELQKSVDQKTDSLQSVTEEALKSKNVANVSKANDKEQNVDTKMTDSTVNDFIKKYLTSKNGNIYVSANAINASNILDGVIPYYNLVPQQRQQLNLTLKAKIGKTYTNLVTEAQKLVLSGKAKTSKRAVVNTATNTNTTLYAWLCAASIGMLTFVLKRLRKQD